MISEFVNHAKIKKEFIKKCISVLKPGGFIIISQLSKTLFDNKNGKIDPLTYQELERITEENCTPIVLSGIKVDKSTDKHIVEKDKYDEGNYIVFLKKKVKFNPTAITFGFDRDGAIKNM